MQTNILENLELKLANTRFENSEKLDLIESEYKKEYSSFFDTIFENNTLWFKRFVSVTFQLTKLDNPNLNNNEIFKQSLEKAIKLLPLDKNKKILLESKLLFLLNNKEKVENIFLKNTDLHKNYNFPILESLENLGLLDKNDLLQISLKFKETSNFLDSILILPEWKKDLIKKYYYELNNTRKEDRIENFKHDFHEEIRDSKNIQIYPRVLSFIWKNYLRLKINNKLESKKEMLRRVFRIAFLKLYRLKYSGIDITNILSKINSLDDFDSMISLLLKFFDQLKENPTLSKDYIISDEIDEVNEIYIDAEDNKNKILFLEENTIKATNLLEKWEKYITWYKLDAVLDTEVDLVWDNFINRAKPPLVITDPNWDLQKDKEEEEDDELDKEINLEEYYEQLKLEFERLDKIKKKLFLKWNYAELDSINDSIASLLIKLEKVSKLIWLEL